MLHAPRSQVAFALVLLTGLLAEPLLRLVGAAVPDGQKLASSARRLMERHPGRPALLDPLLAVALGSEAVHLPALRGQWIRPGWPEFGPESLHLRLRGTPRPPDASARPEAVQEGADGSEGQIRATLLRGPSAPGGGAVGWWLRRELARGDAQVLLENEVAPCRPFDGLRMACSPRGYHFVGRHSAPFRGLDLPCVWMHPVGHDRLLLRIPDLPETREVRGWVALVDGAGRRADVEVEIRVGGRHAARARVSADDGLHRLSGRLLRPQSGDLEVTVRTDDDRWRLLCLDLFGLTEAPE